jgi:hypothetical protein
MSAVSKHNMSCLVHRERVSVAMRACTRSWMRSSCNVDSLFTPPVFDDCLSGIFRRLHTRLNPRNTVVSARFFRFSKSLIKNKKQILKKTHGGFERTNDVYQLRLPLLLLLCLNPLLPLLHFHFQLFHLRCVDDIIVIIYDPLAFLTIGVHPPCHPFLAGPLTLTRQRLLFLVRCKRLPQLVFQTIRFIYTSFVPVQQKTVRMAGTSQVTLVYQAKQTHVSVYS